MDQMSVNLKALNIEITRKCNLKCQICNIWNSENKQLINYNDLATFLKRYQDKLAFVEEISLTGGEVFTSNDIIKIVDSLRSNLPSLKVIFINTNGSLPEKVDSFLSTQRECLSLFAFCISLDGSPEYHNLIRGVPCFDKLQETIKIIKQHSEVNIIISTTFTRLNTTIENISFVDAFAKKIGASFTFRPYDRSEQYYENSTGPSLEISDNQRELLINYLGENHLDNKYFAVLKKFLRTNKISPICPAGSAFVFISSDGSIRPCPWYTKTIGFINDLNIDFSKEIEVIEKCYSCCSDCRIYPTLNYGNKNQIKEIAV